MVPGTGKPDTGGWGLCFVLSLDGRPLAHTAPHGCRVDWLGSPPGTVHRERPLVASPWAVIWSAAT
jgi:hypothetical protein